MLGEITMKNVTFFNFNSLIAIIASLSALTAVAEGMPKKKHSDAIGNHMQVKCYVEYQGGGDDIRFITGSFNKPSQAIAILQGRKVNKHNTQISKIIYKVNECVKGNKLFKSKVARKLDKNMLK